MVHCAQSTYFSFINGPSLLEFLYVKLLIAAGLPRVHIIIISVLLSWSSSNCSIVKILQSRKANPTVVGATMPHHFSVGLGLAKFHIQS